MVYIYLVFIIKLFITVVQVTCSMKVTSTTCIHVQRQGTKKKKLNEFQLAHQTSNSQILLALHVCHTFYN